MNIYGGAVTTFHALDAQGLHIRFDTRSARTTTYKMSACNAFLAAFQCSSPQLTASSTDDPPHDLVAADGRRLVLDVEPQGDELILDAVIFIVVVVLLLGGLDDLAARGAVN